MNRFTPEAVRQLFAEIGAKPIQGRWDNHAGDACCVLGALNKRLGQPFNVRGIALETGMDYDYLLGVMHGWDGRPEVSTDAVQPYHNAELWRQGYDDGVAAWEAVNA